MAEFISATAGGDITTDSAWGAAGDIIYATDSATATVLNIGCTNAVLQVSCGLPAWTTSPTIGSTSFANANHAHAASNSGGTIALSAATGTLAVDSGGTGLTCLTTGSVLIGTGSSDVTLVDMATKGDILIGDGTTAPQVLDVGTNCQVLTASSGCTTGVKWAAAAGGTSISLVLALNR